MGRGHTQGAGLQSDNCFSGPVSVQSWGGANVKVACLFVLCSM